MNTVRFFLLLTGVAMMQVGVLGQVITSGEAAAGSISVSGELDEWTFEAAKDSAIRVSIGEVLEGEVDPGFWPWIRLYGPDESELQSRSGNWVGQINQVAPLSGTYRVVVGSNDSGRDGTGDYLLHLAVFPGEFVVPEGDEGGALINGESHTGSLHVGDLDLWSFEAGKDDFIALSIGEVLESEVDPDFWPWIRLYGPTGAELASRSGRWVGQISIKAPLTGTYTVLVASNDTGNDATGDYLLHLALSPGEFVVPEGDQGGALTVGDRHPGSIYIGDLDMWSLEAAKDDSILLSVGEVLEGEIDPGFWPWIRLYGPDGAELQSRSGNWVGQINQVAPLTGTYTVVVGSNDSGNDAAGDYELHYARSRSEFMVPEEDEGGTMVNGAAHPGRIDIGDLDMWSFEAGKDHGIVLSIGEVLEGEIDPGFWPWIRLYGPDGAELRSRSGDWVGQINQVAPLTGTYIVVVASNDSAHDASGDYRLHLALSPGEFTVPEGDQGGSLVSGGNHAGTIHKGDLDLWSFPALAGDQIHLSIGEVLESEIDPGFWPWIRLFGPDGDELQSRSGNWVGQINEQATLSGMYTVVVASNDSANDAEGDYLLHFGVAPEFCATPSGDEGGALPHSGVANGHIHGGDLDFWTFEADAGNDLVVRLSKTSGTDFYPWVRLYDKNGGLISSRSHPSEAQIVYRATASCLYQVVVASNDSGNDAIGNYELEVTGLPVQGKYIRYGAVSGDNITLNWPAELGAQVLQSNSVVDPEGWEAVDLVPSENGLNVWMLIPVETEGNRYFRLWPVEP